MHSGHIDFKYGDETFQTWFTVAGDLTSGRRPLVAVHGGPGIPSPYMLPHLELAKSAGIPVILYDQIGCGKSTSLRGKDPSFFTVEFFMDELENVLAHFNIAHDFDLLGHSWGGMLAADWVTSRHPAGLHRLVLADSLVSIELWKVSVNKLLRRFPKEFQDMLRKHEEEGTTDSQEYQDGMTAFYQKHICTLDPWPEQLNQAFAALGEDPTVYSTMFGVSEFSINGTLKDWSVVDKLHTITCPTLIINGVDDEAQDECVAPFFTKIPKAKWVQFAKSSHMPFFEEPERYFQVLSQFLSV
ncbi:proline-specific peptidase [Peniophora sp. CONT]|nr:proline-specific peptidase [Peniophora sp. CONT]